MKKILFGMAFLAGLASCSKDEEYSDGLGKYKVEATYSCPTADTKDPVNVTLTFASAGKLYTYDKDGKPKKVDGKVYYLENDASPKDTTICVFTDEESMLSFNMIAISMEDGNKFSYDIKVSRDGKTIDTFKDNLILNYFEDKTIIY